MRRPMTPGNPQNYSVKFERNANQLTSTVGEEINPTVKLRSFRFDEVVVVEVDCDVGSHQAEKETVINEFFSFVY